jgi:hypothetical protein
MVSIAGKTLFQSLVKGPVSKRSLVLDMIQNSGLNVGRDRVKNYYSTTFRYHLQKGRIRKVRLGVYTITPVGRAYLNTITKVRKTVKDL